MGMAYSNKGPFTIVSGEALEADRLIRPSTLTAMYADAGEEPIGITTEAVATATPVACECLDGTIHKVTGALAISAGTAIYCAADGKVSSAAVGKQIGIILEATTANGGKAPAIIWGPRGGNDMLSAKGGAWDYFDDFFNYDPTATVGEYAAVSDGGAVDVGDADNGVLSIADGATDNDETYISSIHEIIKFATDKRLFFEARVKLTEANTDDANIIIGLSDIVAANSLLDNGAGPMASYDGACFFKVDGGVVWQFETSNAGTQLTNTSVAAFVTATWYKLGFLYDPNDGVTAIVTPYVDGVASTAKNLTIAGLDEMHILMGVKAGGANAETLLVDYVHIAKER